MRDQQIIIVGGTGSIGFATAELLTSQGAQVAIAGRSRAKLSDAARRISGLQTFHCDITDESSVRSVFTGFNHIDHVVVLAGSAISGPILTTPIQTFRPAVEERIWGPIHVVQAAAPKMKHGSITFTSGLFTERPPESGAAVVAAACAGVEGLVRALARELAPLRVNAVNFGWVRSGHHSFLGDQQEEHYAQVGATLPVGRVANPDEAAHAILFALTNEYVTGEVYHVDGGARLV